MKRRILILLLILALVLTACGKKSVRTVEYRGITFILDTESQTITQDGNVYRYEIEDRGSGSTYTITYPDGATYAMSWSGSIGSGGGNALYYDTDLLDGDVLIDILREELPKSKDPAMIFLSIICIGLGTFDAAAPEAACYLSRGWRYKNAEPSELYLTLTRISGFVLIILGVILLFV